LCIKSGGQTVEFHSGLKKTPHWGAKNRAFF
jgi:hypothetical protein